MKKSHNVRENKISVYVRSIGISPSGYYRIMQYLNNLNVKVRLNNIVPPSIYSYYLHNKQNNKILSVFLLMLMFSRVIIFLGRDILCPPNTIIISRGLIPRLSIFPVNFLLKLAQKRCKNIIWDFDDDILESKEISFKEFQILESISDKILVTHKYLASKINPKYQKKSILIPTTDGDFEKFDIPTIIENRSNSIDKNINLVWIGSAVNLNNLKYVIPALDKVAEYQERINNRSTTLLICSSEDLQEKTKHLKILNIRWSPERAIETILSSHIGIMPLINERYALGKGGFKLVQYMASGLPIIGSNVGFNQQIVRNEYGRLIDNLESEEEWGSAISELTQSKEEYCNAAMSARNSYEKKFHYRDNLDIWKELINNKS